MNYKQAALSLVAGVLGMLVVYGAQHVWYDHRNLHAIISMVERQQRDAQQTVVPASGPPPMTVTIPTPAPSPLDAPSPPAAKK